MTFTTFLLSKFTRNITFGSDGESFMRRQQVLSIIYANFGVILIISGYEALMWLAFRLQALPLLTCVALPCIIASLTFLKRGNNETAAFMVIVCMHAVNFSAGNFAGAPVAALYVLAALPNFTFILTSSTKIHIFSSVVWIGQYLRHIYNIHEIFQVTLTEEQAVQIGTLYASGFIVPLSLLMTMFVQKATEKNLWRIAQSNFEKSEKLTKEVLQAIEAKDCFLSSLSHEIRNPLNSMNGSIDYLLKVVKDVNHLQILRNAKVSSEILLNLVNNVLDAAKLKSDKMELSSLETNFTDIVRKVFIINSDNMRRNLISAKAYIDEKLPAVIWIDPSRLLQITMNLISNALKFTPRGGKINIYVSWCSGEEEPGKLLAKIDENSQVNQVEQQVHRPEQSLPAQLDTLESNESPRIMPAGSEIFKEFNIQESQSRQKNLQSIPAFKVNTRQNPPINVFSLGNEPWKICQAHISPSNSDTCTQGFLKVQVSDTGNGISETDVPKLFKMFAQAHRSSDPMHGGTGLGLWICKQLCQKMGGDITLYSQLGQGTTFVFYIPVNNDRITAPERSSFTKNEKVTVIVADDYAHNRDLHKLLLEREGAQVVLAMNGRETFEKYKAAPVESVDFIMMDVAMPEVDGFSAAKMIRDWEAANKRRKVDIYFVSGEYFNEEEVMAGFVNRGGKAGAADGIRCLRKPVDIEMVGRIVERYKKHGEPRRGVSRGNSKEKRGENEIRSRRPHVE